MANWKETSRSGEKRTKLPLSMRELAELGGKKLVYVRTVLASECVDDLVDDETGAVIDIPGDTTLYSVHSGDGQRIGHWVPCPSS